MSRTPILLTDTYQQVAATKCVITIMNGGGLSYFNEVASDGSAVSDVYPKNAQIVQNETKATFARSRDAGISIIVDEV